MLPPYVAVSECVPTARSVVASVAIPPAPTAAVPIELAPSKNSTVPVASFGVTAALRLTWVPTTAGFTFELSATDDVTAVTTCVYGPADADGAKCESPGYDTVSGCEPGTRLLVDSVASPVNVLSDAVPITVPA